MSQLILRLARAACQVPRRAVAGADAPACRTGFRRPALITRVQHHTTPRAPSPRLWPPRSWHKRLRLSVDVVTIVQHPSGETSMEGAAAISSPSRNSARRHLSISSSKSRASQSCGNAYSSSRTYPTGNSKERSYRTNVRFRPEQGSAPTGSASAQATWRWSARPGEQRAHGPGASAQKGWRGRSEPLST